MSLQTVLNAIRLWNSSNPWNFASGPQPSAFSTADETALLNYISSLYTDSPNAAALLESMTQGTSVIRIGNTNLGPGFFVQPSGGDEYILLNFNLIDGAYHFTDDGRLIQSDPRFVIAHELGHWGLETDDAEGFDSLSQPSDAVMNGADYDNAGSAVDFERLVALELGVSADARTSYQAALLDGDSRFGSFSIGISYTGGAFVDIVRIGDRFSLNNVDTIDVSSRTDGKALLAFGLEGNDVIKGGDGDDHLYGGTGSDKIYGDAYADHLYGGDDNDFLDSGLNVIDPDSDEGGDTLDGGADDDILIIRGIFLESASGGTGGDEFWIVSPGESSYWIADSDPADSLYYNGYQLLGGTKQVIDLIHDPASLENCASEVGALDSYGFIYYWDGEQLSISTPDGSGIMIQDFENGDFGINVGSAISQSEVVFGWAEVQPDVWEVRYFTLLSLSSIADNGEDWDYYNLPGYSTTASTLGPNTPPETFMV